MPTLPSLAMWSTTDGSRYFLIPNHSTLHPGTVEIRNLDGQTKLVELQNLLPFEVTENQACYWAKHELSRTLEELKHGLDERLADLRRQLDEKNRTPVTENTTVTPN